MQVWPTTDNYTKICLFSKENKSEKNLRDRNEFAPLKRSNTSAENNLCAQIVANPVEVLLIQEHLAQRPTEGTGLRETGIRLGERGWGFNFGRFL